MINRRHLVQSGASAVMAFTILPKATGSLAMQVGPSLPSTPPRSPVGEEIWTLAIDATIYSVRYSADASSSGPSDHCLVLSSGYMANIDMNELSVPWEAPTPFAVTSIGSGGYPESDPENFHLNLYGTGRVGLVEASSGEVVFDTSVSGDSVQFIVPSEGHPYVRESGVTPGNDRVRGFDLETNEEVWTLSPVMQTRRNGQALIVVMEDTVAAHDIETGDVLWSTGIPGVQEIISYANGLLATSATEITAMDIDTGDMRWIATVPDRSELRTFDDYGLLSISGNRLILIDLETGLETWSISFDSFPSIMDSMDRSILVTDGWMVKLVDLEGGQVTWESTYDDELDTAYVREQRWRIRAGDTLALLASDQARIIWEWEWDGNGWWRARFTSDHLIRLTSRSEITCASVETGRVLWTTPFEMWGEVEYTISDGMLGITIDGGPCHVFDMETGDEVRTIGENNEDFTTTLSSGYVVYFGNSSASITHMSTGSYIGALSFSSAGSLDISSRYISTDEIIALLDEDRTSVIARIPIRNVTQLQQTDNNDWIIHSPSDLYLYDSTGNRLWTIPLDTPISSIRTFEEQAILFVLFESHSWIVDHAEGRILWEVPVGAGAGWLDTLLLVQDRMLVITERRASIFQAPQTTVTSRDIALRGAPNENAVERAQLSAGTEVVPTGNTRDINGTTWLEVLAGTVTGWLPEDALTTASTAPSATPVASPVASPVATPAS